MTTYPITGCFIPLGIQGEKNTRRFAFDITGYEDYDIIIAYRRPGSDIPYYVETAKEESLLYWITEARDVEFPGSGTAVMRFYKGEELRKSCAFETVVRADPLLDVGDPPEDFETWFNRLSELALSANQSAERARSSSASAAASAAEAGGHASAAERFAGTAAGAAGTAVSAASSAEFSENAAKSAQAEAQTAASKAGQNAVASESAAKSAQAAQLEAKKAAGEIKSITASAETLPAGSPASAFYNPETGAMIFGIPRGAPGAPGKTPVKGVDYFTPSEVNDIASEAAKKVPAPDLSGYAKTTDLTSEVTRATNAEHQLSEGLNQLNEDIATINDRIDNIDDVIIETVEPLQKEVDEHDRQLDNIEEASKGNIYSETVIEGEDYSKDIPSGVLPWGKLDSIGGKSVAFNQLLASDNFRASNTYFTNNGDGSFTVNGQGSGSYRFVSYFDTSKVPIVISGHKYYSNIGHYNLYLRIENESGGVNYGDSIIVPSISGKVTVFTSIKPGVSYNNVRIYPCLIDLTQMFGAGNEPTIEECQRIFADDYYPYNEGEIISADVDKVVNKGRNLTREDFTHLGYGGDNPNLSLILTRLFSEKIAAKEGEVLFCEVFGSSAIGEPLNFNRIILFDKDKNFIRRDNLSDNGLLVNTSSFRYTIPSGVGYVMLDIRTTALVTKLNETDAHLVVSRVSDTRYTPYFEKDYPIKEIIRKYFPNGMKSAMSVHDVFDIEKGVAVQSVDSVDLGTMVWFASGYGEHIFRSNNMPTNHSNGAFLTARYTKTSNSFVDMPNMTIRGTTSNFNTLCVRDDSYVDASAFGNAMSGEYLYYELATPIETPIDKEDLEALRNIQLEGGGSLTFEQTDIHLPVPNKETIYIKSGIRDVQINGSSIVTDGVADIPVATASTYGVVKTSQSYGTLMRSGAVTIAQATETEIDTRSNNYKPIVPNNLDYAVKSALCDGKGAEYTDAEKASARERIGASGGKFELIEKITLTEDTSSIKRSATPNGTPYSFAHIHIVIILPVTSSTFMSFMSLNGAESIGYAVARYNASGGANASATVFDANVESGLVDGYSGHVGGSFGNIVGTSKTGWGMGAVQPSVANPYPFPVEVISSIFVGAYNAVFPSGTIITIYGK